MHEDKPILESDSILLKQSNEIPSSKQNFKLKKLAGPKAPPVF